MRRKPRPQTPDLRAQWQRDNAARCGCRGTDDLCPCQNDPELFTRGPINWRQRALIAEGDAALAEAKSAALALEVERLRAELDNIAHGSMDPSRLRQIAREALVETAND